MSGTETYLLVFAVAGLLVAVAEVYCAATTDKAALVALAQEH